MFSAGRAVESDVCNGGNDFAEFAVMAYAVGMNNIADALIKFAVPIESLTLDPANARRHPARNIEAIKGSLARFKQQKPIVIDADGVVIAGNGTLVAAKELGWDKIAAVKSSLKGIDRAMFAIADNRTPELAEWDDDTLQRTLAQFSDDDIAMLGFVEQKLDSAGGDGSAQLIRVEYKIMVDCESEEQQRFLLSRFQEEGITCRALTA